MRDRQTEPRWYDSILESLAADPVRDKSDERALSRGMRFNIDRAQHVCDFFPDMLTLYEGRKAGQPFDLMPWQVEVLSRVFGWEKYSEFCKRMVRRFRKVSLWVPKKNGKSPTAAGVGLYLFCADGEPGQKVFTAARDGKQALIVHTHAKKMVRSSPYLSIECRINNTTNVISHDVTDSMYSLLSGDNIEGQEGLNGSVVIDETHVVDDRLAGRLEGMGISRDEPMQFEVSTAGDNPLGYGRRQYEYGKAVRDGMVEDDGFFFQTYEAPADLTDAELMDPELWEKANPSWGVTINSEEMAESAKRAHRSAVDWQRFKMYRLNIWASAADPWIRIHQWNACREEFDESHLYGRACWLGLDLARTTDTSAVSLIFPEVDGTYWILPYFWLPESQVDNLSAKVPQVKDWVARGLITMTGEQTTDYATIRRDIRKMASNFNIQAIIYDEH
jgi:phage terminase large subunit-like protein